MQSCSPISWFYHMTSRQGAKQRHAFNWFIIMTLLLFNIQLLTYVEVDMECYWTVNVILTDAERRSIWLSLLFNNTPCLPKHKSTIVLLYNKCMLCISCHFWPKNVHVTDGSCKITWRSDVTSRKPVNITSCRVLCNVTSGKPCNM